MNLFQRAISITISLLALSFSAVQAAALDKPLEVIVFPGGFNWPIFVAEEKGFFAAEGIAVNVTPTPDSKYQMVNFIDGKFDIAMTAMDNVVAYAEGQGAAPTQATPDIVAFMGSDNGFLRLVSIPEVKTVADLKGKRVGVDALTTGYAFVLREMLELGGLDPAEFEYVQAGGVMKRFEALMQKSFAATLLISPFEAAAQRDGFNILANGSEALGAYQGVVGAVRRGWAKEHGDQLVSYIAAYQAALDWLYNPANKDEAIPILLKSVPGMKEPVAKASYQILLDDKFGFYKSPTIDEKGVETVLALRSKYAEPKKELADPAHYYDTQYLERALAPKN
ncbi:ABC transporter substrate-binding protein [Pusillimonas noertemannii]|uniref:ABC transporter substrate-binding protein n=1 Tax=Pusillimonas noertemannii TaxID=305977 RepID=UPI00058D60B6|nr:ABC transporter substrate-binding protein [Pusillimonas noertemannii]